MPQSTVRDFKLVSIFVSQSNSGFIIADLNEAGQKTCIANGGRGGNPENTFLGQKGEALTLNLDLKLIADIGLVG